MRRFVASGVSAFLILGLLACGPAPTSGPAAPAATAPSASPPTPAGAAAVAPTVPPRERVKLAYGQRTPGQGMHVYGLEGGYFDHYGVEVEATQIPGATVLAAALISGEVHIGTVGATAPTEARLGGADLVMIADMTPVMVFWLFGRPELSTVADLRGKRVGVTRIGTATHYAARVALRHGGLDPERDVTYLNMSTLGAIVAGMEANSLDAGILTQAEKYEALKLGHTMLFDVSAVSPPYSSAGLVASEAWTRERPDLMLRFLRGHLDGLKRLRADPEWGKQVMARWLQTDDQTLIEESYDIYVRRHLPAVPAPKTESVAPILELAALSNPRAATMSPNEIIEPRFIQQLEAEGFFEQPPAR